MPLPKSSDQSWPPDLGEGLNRDLAEWAAWYSGDTLGLGNYYEPVSRTRKEASNSLTARQRFWGRRGNELSGSRVRLHVPVASDIAATSADLLFGEEIEITIREAHEERASSESIATQDRIDDIYDKTGLANLLLEGAEVCAGIGGVYLRPAWDLELASHPLLYVHHQDVAVPEWRNDILYAVTFWQTLRVDGQTVVRLLERHEPGHIETGVYVGTEGKLGTRGNLANYEETKQLTEDYQLPPEFGKRLLVSYIPNVRPHRRLRHLPIGRPDFAGAEGLMDAIDETYSSLMRDIRLGQSRVIVAQEALQRKGRGQGATFNVDQEVFTGLNMEPGVGDPITPIQFLIRTTEHLETAMNLFEQTVTLAGYSKQTFGMAVDGQAESGTALRVKEGKTLRTNAKKARYWESGIEQTVENLLLIDRVILQNTDIMPVRPVVNCADVIAQNPLEVGQAITLFRQAKAASIETAVRLAQPELDEQAIKEEVQRIKDEDSIVADPTGGFV